MLIKKMKSLIPMGPRRLSIGLLQYVLLFLLIFQHPLLVETWSIKVVDNGEYASWHLIYDNC